MDKDLRFDFLKEAIIDTQGTIRSIDVKAGAIIAVLVIPIGQAKEINTIINYLMKFNCNCIFFIAISLGLLSWSLSLLSCIRVLFAIDNPANHIEIDSNEHINGSFYGGGLFKLNLRDVFFNNDIKSEIDLNSFSEKIPQNNESIIKELIFEKMKLSYIRDIKIYRLNFALYALIVWFIVSIILVLIYKFT